MSEKRKADPQAAAGAAAAATAQTAIERRILPAAELRVVDEEGKPRRLVGYAAVFDRRSVDMGFIEVIKPGAFKDVLAKGPDVRALVNHDPNLLLARTKAGTLRLKEDDKGLVIDADLPDTQTARDLTESIRRGDLDQMSFAFSLPIKGGDEWAKDGDTAGYIRTILKIENLYDVSPVTFPAYPDTSVALRSLAEFRAAEPPPAPATPPTVPPAEPPPVEPPETPAADPAPEAEPTLHDRTVEALGRWAKLEPKVRVSLGRS